MGACIWRRALAIAFAAALWLGTTAPAGAQAQIGYQYNGSNYCATKGGSDFASCTVWSAAVTGFTGNNLSYLDSAWDIYSGGVWSGDNNAGLWYGDGPANADGTGSRMWVYQDNASVQARTINLLSTNGINAGSQPIHNLAPGSAPSDAVTKSQLDAQATHYVSINSTATGTGSNYGNDGATGANALAIGLRAAAVGANDVAIGAGSVTSGGGSSIAIGGGQTSGGTSSQYSMAVGAGAITTGGAAMAFGQGASAVGSAVAIGQSASTNSNNSIAIGTGANVTLASPSNGGGVAVGGGATVSGSFGIAMGSATKSADGGVAIGTFAGATSSAVAIGQNADARGVASSVALGAYSVSTAVNKSKPVTINGSAGAIAGSTPLAVVSVGNPSNTNASINGGKPITRQVTGVGAGVISPASTDAVNGSQLYAVGAQANANSANLLNLGTGVASGLGGASNYNAATGQLGTNLNVGGTSYNSVNGALNAVNATASAGWSLSANGGTPVNVAPGATVDVAQGTNVVVTQAANGNLTFATSLTPNFTTVTTTGALTAGGVFTANGGLVVGAGKTVSMSGNKITNVASGTVSTDAVNLSQLQAAQAAATAHYYGVNGTATGAGSNYDNDGAVGSGSLAAGENAVAWSADSTAVGTDAVAGIAGSADDCCQASAFGGGAQAVATHATALGQATEASGANATAVGQAAAAAGVLSLAVGQAADASGDNTTALGQSAAASARNATAVGQAASAARNATAVGQGATAGNGSATAVGQSAGATAGNATAVGARASAGAAGGTAIGVAASAVNANDVALGSGSVTGAPSTGPYDINGGAVAAPNASNGVVSVGAVGAERQIQNVAAGAVAAGSTDAVNGAQLFAVGTALNNFGAATANAFGGGATYNAATGTWTAPSYAINGVAYNSVGAALAAATPHYVSVTDGGTQQTNYNNNGATGANAVAIGAGASGANSTVAIGHNASAKSSNAGSGVAIGEGAVGIGPAVVIGQGANGGSDGTASVAVGQGAQGNTTGVAIGQNSNAVSPGAVALGVDSIAGAAVAASGATINGIQYTFLGGTSPTMVVSIGNATTARQLQNVAAGRINSASTDAVNGSQLYATDVVLGNAAGSIASGMGGGSKVNPDGSVTTELTVGSNSYSSVNSALNAVNATASAGWSLSANGGTPVNVAPGATVDVAQGTNVVVTQAANGSLTFATSLTPTFTTVTTTGALTTGGMLNVNGGVTVAAGQTVDMGSNRLTNIAAGSADTDAVNVSQLNTLAAAAATEVLAGTNVAGVVKSTDASDGHGVYTVNADGASVSAGSSAVTVAKGSPGADNVTDYEVDLAQATKDEIQQGVDAKAAVDTDGLTFHADSGATGVKKLGDSVAVTGDGNVTTTADANGVQFALNKDLALGPNGSVALGNTMLNGSGLVIASGPSITAAGIDAGSQVITNVAPGTAGTDAVNVDQLHAVSTAAGQGWNLTTAASGTGVASGTTVAGVAPGGTLTIAAGDNLAVAQNATAVAIGLNPVLVGMTSIAFAGGGPRLGSAGIDMGATRMTNLAPGTAGTDAVNLDQLQAISVAAGQGWKLSTNGGAPVAIQPNASVDMAHGANIVVTQDATTGNVTIATSDAPTFTRVTTGNSRIDNDGVTVADGAGNVATLGTTGASVADGTSSAQYGAQGMTIVGGPSVTVAGIDAAGRKITDVAAGTADTDAVNVGQLAGVVNGARTHYYSVNDGGTPGSNFDNDGAAGANAIAAGVGAAAPGASGVAVGAGAVAVNALDVALGADSVTADPHPTADVVLYDSTYGFAGSDPAAVVSVGSIGHERQVTNVAAGRLGAGSTDAVNGSQLHATNEALTAIGAQVAVNAGDINDLKSRVDNIHPQGSGMFEASADRTEQPAATGTNSAAGGARASAAGSGALAVGNDSSASGDGAAAIGTGAVASADNSVALGAGSIADQEGTVAVGSDGHERRVTHVAAGTAATDAVNVAQLQSAQQGGVHYDAQADGAVDYASITLNPGGDAPTVIRNVATGVADGDAVNVGQLNTGIAGAINTANAYTDQRYTELRGSLNRVGNRANAGVASAIAAASLPQPYAPNQNSAGVGLGSFHGEAGVAVGLSRITENGRFILKANLNSSSRGDLGGGVGAGIVW